MTIALFGGTGFIGRYVLEKLLKEGFNVNVLVREGSELRYPDESKNIKYIIGDARDDQAQFRTLTGADCVIYLIGLIRQFPFKGITFQSLHYEVPVSIMKLSTKIGIQRFIYMSANGVKPKGTPYQTTKYMAEKELKKIGLNSIILRPSIIFGDPGRRIEFCTQLRDEMILPPFPAPLFFEGISIATAGQFRLSPIHVDDVTDIIINSIQDQKSIGKIYHLGGPDDFSWKEIIQMISNAVHRKKVLLPAPIGIVKLAAGIFDRWEWFPVTRDQITMLLEGNVCDSSEVFNHFGIIPKKFCEEELTYLIN